MFFHFLPGLSDVHILFNLFSYQTFRAAGAGATAFLIAFMAGPWTIARLRRLKAGQPIRSTGPDSHQVKEGTPTMGGVLLILGATVSTLLWGDLRNPYVLIALLSIRKGEIKESFDLQMD